MFHLLRRTIMYQQSRRIHRMLTIRICITMDLLTITTVVTIIITEVDIIVDGEDEEEDGEAVIVVATMRGVQLINMLNTKMKAQKKKSTETITTCSMIKRSTKRKCRMNRNLNTRKNWWRS